MYKKNDILLCLNKIHPDWYNKKLIVIEANKGIYILGFLSDYPMFRNNGTWTWDKTTLDYVGATLQIFSKNHFPKWW